MIEDFYYTELMEDDELEALALLGPANDDLCSRCMNEVGPEESHLLGLCADCWEELMEDDE